VNLKVSVLSSGSILLDGTPVGLANLKAALEQADRANDRILYYREDAAAEPPPQTKEVLDLVIANKLPISLSSKPDFSDYADQFGRLHPRPEDAGGPPNRFEPRMPDVDPRADAAAAFAKARAKASGENENFRIAVVRPDRAVLFFPLPPPPPQTSEMAKKLSSVVPSDRGRNIAVISSTEFTMSRTGAGASLQEANSAIPFIGILCGLAYLGHRIWIFEGHPSALPLGLEQSDVLVVDSGMLPFLQPDWMQVAQRVMQDDPRIFVHDRKTYRLLQKFPPVREPDGEGSYANCLLTALGKAAAGSVEVAAGGPVPNLTSLTRDPEELKWIAELPFRYETLDSQKVIDVLLTAAGRSKLNPFKREWTLKTKLVAKGAEPKLITFTMRLEKDVLVINKLA
jgi:hypothetical protein